VVSQQLCHTLIGLVTVQRRVSIAAILVDVGAMLQKKLHRAHISKLHCLHQRRLAKSVTDRYVDIAGQQFPHKPQLPLCMQAYQQPMARAERLSVGYTMFSKLPVDTTRTIPHGGQHSTAHGQANARQSMP